MTKKYIVFILSFFIVSCGFNPLYKNNSILLDYDIDVIVKSQEGGGKDNQIMKNFLSKSLSKQNNKASNLKLIVSLQKVKYSLGLQKDLTTTRAAVSYNVNYAFYDRKGLISSGSLQKSTSYNIGTSPYASIKAEETSSHNVIKFLANEISLIVLALPQNRKIYP